MNASEYVLFAFTRDYLPNNCSDYREEQWEKPTKTFDSEKKSLKNTGTKYACRLPLVLKNRSEFHTQEKIFEVILLVNINHLY